MGKESEWDRRGTNPHRREETSVLALLQHLEVPSHMVVGSSPGNGLADLLAFPLLIFMTLIIAGVIAQLICVLKRWGGDWFYNNNSSDS